VPPTSGSQAPPARVIVIGAGIVGLSSAWWLRREGVETIVLDSADPCESASAGNAGLLSIGHYPLNRPGASWKGLRWMASRRSPLYIRPTVDPRVLSWLWSFHRHCNAVWCDRCLAALCALGFPSLQALELMLAEESIKCDYARDGWLDVVLSASALHEAERDARAIERFGYSFETLSGSVLRAAHPVFRSEVAGAVHYRDSARMHPGTFLRGLLDAVRRRGASVRLDARVDAIMTAGDRASDGTGTRADGGASTRADGGTSVRGVRLASGEEIEADAVVVAAGVWSSALVEPLGVRLPLMAARGYHLHFPSVPAMPGTGCVLSETKVAVTPMGASLRLAGTLELGSTGRPWMRERVDAIVDGAARYFNGVREWHGASEWAGYRPCLPDGMPMVGAVPWVPGLMIATGHAMMGMTLGPISGRIVCDRLMGREPTVDDSMLSAARFGRMTPRVGRQNQHVGRQNQHVGRQNQHVGRQNQHVGRPAPGDARVSSRGDERRAAGANDR